MARYVVVPPYRIESSYSHSIEGELVEVIVEIADLLDTQTNTQYQAGAWRVRVTNRQAIPLYHDAAAELRTKSFKGESAWSNAERYAQDVNAKLRRL